MQQRRLLISDTPRLALTVAVFLLAVAPMIRAAADGDEEDGKKEAKFVLGQVVSLDDGKMVVRSGPANSPTETTLLINRNSFHPEFVGFKGMGKPTDKVAVGQFIKVGIPKDGVIKGGLFSPAFGPIKEIENRHKLSAKELFKKADENGDGKVDYLEYATWIFQSVKHLPDKFKTKLDANGDDTLDLKEFEAALELLTWYRVSRKTPEQWIAEYDKNKNGELDPEEARPLLVVGHSGDTDAKRKKLFEKLDTDKSGGLTAREFEPKYQSLVEDRN